MINIDAKPNPNQGKLDSAKDSQTNKLAHKEAEELAAPAHHTEIGSPEHHKEISHTESETKLLESSERMKDLENQLKRLAAEFDNYRKRAAKEVEQARDGSAGDVYLRFLPIVDEFELAVIYASKAASAQKGGVGQTEREFLRGFEMIYSKLLDSMKKDGVLEMDCLGQPFDPYKHDALRSAEGKDGIIIEVIQKGYSFKGRVLRHAKVVVGNGEENVRIVCVDAKGAEGKHG